MGNLGETKTISKLIIEMGGDEYVFAGGGGGIEPGVPLPDDTVGSNAIIDGAVQMHDLSEDVKEKMKYSYDAEGEGITLGGIVGNNAAAHDVNGDNVNNDI